MDIKKIESNIKKLKSKAGKGEDGDPLLVRSTKKCLKRAQRKRNKMIKKAAFVQSKGKKKDAAS